MAISSSSSSPTTAAAGSSSLKPRYPSPPSRQATHHNRRFSGSRRSSTSASTIPHFPNAESPRTLCPRDHVAFAYDPSHLKQWYMPQELWDKLPQTLHSSIAAVQHAGAAVMTGFARLQEAHQEAMHEKIEEEKAISKEGEAGEAEEDVEAPTILSEYDVKAIPEGRHVRHDSGFFSLSSYSTSSSTTPPLQGSTSSISPFELPPERVASPFTPSTTAHSVRTFTMPSSPKDSYYLAELSHLRCEAIPRLRHSVLRVDIDYNELRRVVELLQKQGEFVEDSMSLQDFEEWWKSKKAIVNEAYGRVRTLVAAVGPQSSPIMGWGGA